MRRPPHARCYQNTQIGIGRESRQRLRRHAAIFLRFARIFSQHRRALRRVAGHGPAVSADGKKLH